MKKDGLVFEYITEYIHQIRRRRTGMLGELEETCRRADLPISEPETSDILEILCRICRPKHILEIGTCVGFSSLLMSEACPEAQIVTIERNPAMIVPAKVNFERFGARNIKMLEGNAVELLSHMDDRFDFIFIDAAKGQYPNFLRECIRMLSPGGVIVADNVLFNGYVAKGRPDVHRNQTIVNRLTQFLIDIEAEQRLKTVILPISDGVTVSYMLSEENK